MDAAVIGGEHFGVAVEGIADHDAIAQTLAGEKVGAWFDEKP